MKSFKRAALAALLTSTLLAAAPASALVWTEVGAGNSLATAEVTAGPGLPALDGITGLLTSTNFVNVGPVYEIDLFKIRIADWTTFSASVVSPPTVADTMLFLFDAQGQGVFANDDFDGLNPSLPAGITGSSGDYFLGVAMTGTGATDSAGNDLFTWDSSGGFTVGTPSGAGPLAGWLVNATNDELPYNYSISLVGATVAAVPEPASALMMLLGIGGLVAGRSLRRGQQAA